MEAFGKNHNKSKVANAMRISRRFRLGATQYELDFVDIDTDRDTPLFLDPVYLGNRADAWSLDAARTLHNFFQTFVAMVREGARDAARNLFDHLHEPNETCLGLSQGEPRGNAIGEVDSEKLFDSIVESRAVATGVVADLEDFRLFIPGIDRDKVSDMTTNIIRRHLVQYTQNQCALWGIPVQNDVQSGYYWDARQRAWVNAFTSMLVIEGKRILLTPKGVVSYSRKYTPRKYYRKFVLEFLQHEHLRQSGSVLVKHRRDGAPYVTKKSLEETVAPYSKEFLTSFTEGHPEVFRDFKRWIKETATPISNSEIVDDNARRIAQFLIDKLRQIPTGNQHATAYHRLVVGILELLLYPDVTSPVVEHEIHEGRKRIDISFDNAATSGFFFRLHTTYDTPSQFIFVECKNYSTEVANPELDQLSGRFSTNRGKFGLLLCRSVDDMATLLRRCYDTYTDQRGTILPIVDDDLVAMLTIAADGAARPYERFLTQRFRDVALR